MTTLSCGATQGKREEKQKSRSNEWDLSVRERRGSLAGYALLPPKTEYQQVVKALLAVA
jgi:hypothetical protein